MVGNYKNNLEEWLHGFKLSLMEQDSQHIDTLCDDADKKQWGGLALKIHEEAIKIIQHRQYHFTVILAIYLNERNTHSRYTPRSLSYRDYSSQRKPPELFLVKKTTILDRWLQKSTLLVQLSAKYSRSIYYNEYWDEADNCFVRSFFVTP